MGSSDPERKAEYEKIHLEQAIELLTGRVCLPVCSLGLFYLMVDIVNRHALPLLGDTQGFRLGSNFRVVLFRPLLWIQRQTFAIIANDLGLLSTGLWVKSDCIAGSASR